MPESPRIDAERVLAGRYRLRRPIARGGMAEVWEATDDILGRPVAVKMLLPHLVADASFLERFRREAIAAARLAHPNVVATFDTGVDEGVAYIVMELVTGRTLHELLATHGALSPQRAIHVAVKVADALDYAHRHGIVHRDVKPANILLGEGDAVKVADFGIAKAAVVSGADGHASFGALGASDLTRSGMIIGTAKYVSPEQVNGAELDGRSDIYSLGVVLYEMVCGRPPYVGETDVAVAMKHLSDRPLSPRQVRAGIPRPLEAVVLRMLAKSPGDRYGTAAELQSALLSIDLRPDDAVPLVVRDPTPPEGIVAPTFRQSERSWLWPVTMIMAVAVVLGLMGVLFATTETGQRLLNPEPDRVEAEAPALTITGAQAFDPPPGGGSEHDDEVGFLFDGDPGTTWTTETYDTARFGELKKGVGVAVRLSAGAALGDITITSPSRGWSVAVYVADAPRPALAAWGAAVATKSGVDSGETTLDLRGRQGAAVLIWITELGPGRRVVLGEVKVTGGG
ncbi:MAG: protein kinase domain-containing protein [Acidimicrobiales bacterium]